MMVIRKWYKKAETNSKCGSHPVPIELIELLSQQTPHN